METLFGAIPDILKALGHDGGAAEAMVFAAWKQCAGDLITERTEPVEFFENRLIVAVRDITWRMHLEDLAPQMLAKLNSSLEQGTVKFIEFRIEPSIFLDGDTVANVERTGRPVITDSLKNAAEAIADEGLRESFLSAAAVYLEENNGR
jgi:hypothetical protein